MSTQYITPIGLNYKKKGFYLEGVWLWRISGSYSFRDFYRSIWNFLSQLRQWDSLL